MSEETRRKEQYLQLYLLKTLRDTEEMPDVM